MGFGMRLGVQWMLQESFSCSLNSSQETYPILPFPSLPFSSLPPSFFPSCLRNENKVFLFFHFLHLKDYSRTSSAIALNHHTTTTDHVVGFPSVSFTEAHPFPQFLAINLNQVDLAFCTKSLHQFDIHAYPGWTCPPFFCPAEAHLLPLLGGCTPSSQCCLKPASLSGFLLLS